MVITLLSAASLPFLGWIRMSWIGTTLVLILAGAVYGYWRHKIPPERKAHLLPWLERYRNLMPIPSLIVSIFSLFCWGWFW